MFVSGLPNFVPQHGSCSYQQFLIRGSLLIYLSYLTPSRSFSGYLSWGYGSTSTPCCVSDSDTEVNSFELALLSLFCMELNPTSLFGNRKGSSVGKSYKNHFIVRLIRNNYYPLPDCSLFFFFLYISSVFYNNRRISYCMAINTFVLTSSRNILYLLLFSGLASSFHIGGYSYFLTYIVTSHLQHNGSPCFHQ